MASTVAEALDKLLGAEFDLKARLCRVSAIDLEHAKRLVEEHADAMAWREIEIAPNLEPASLNWHGGRLQDWELRRRENQQQVAKITARQDLDREMAEMRRAREIELGL